MNETQNGNLCRQVIYLTTEPPSPKRGEVWLVNFDPTVGSEIKKTRPAVVVSSDSVGRLPIKLIAPITEWKDHYHSNMWHIEIAPSSSNGLREISAVDVLQLRSVDKQRFVQKLGRVKSDIMEEIVAAIAMVIEYE